LAENLFGAGNRRTAKKHRTEGKRTNKIGSHWLPILIL